MKNENRKEIWLGLISGSIFIIMVTFIVGMIVSMIGGSWEIMIQSSAIMTVWTTNLIVSIIAFTVLIMSILIYNTQ